MLVVQIDPVIGVGLDYRVFCGGAKPMLFLVTHGTAEQ